ncbi:MAG: type II toxin-antitoxin system VapC family toxin [Ignavibacteriae bacterium]|nr:type II toxin-antitoxin system VapC family toxin [Ignavibacteriota bacterium]
MILLDTDIIIDCLRDYPPAIQWIEKINVEIAVSVFSAFELFQGCSNKIEIQKVQRLLKQVRHLWLSEEGSKTALQLFTQLRSTQGIDVLDVLIAQTAIEKSLALNTFNTKHYKGIPNLTLIQPYKKK